MTKYSLSYQGWNIYIRPSGYFHHYTKHPLLLKHLDKSLRVVKTDTHAPPAPLPQPYRQVSDVSFLPPLPLQSYHHNQPATPKINTMDCFHNYCTVCDTIIDSQRKGNRLKSTFSSQAFDSSLYCSIQCKQQDETEYSFTQKSPVYDTEDLSMVLPPQLTLDDSEPELFECDLTDSSSVNSSSSVLSLDAPFSTSLNFANGEPKYISQHNASHPYFGSWAATSPLSNEALVLPTASPIYKKKERQFSYAMPKISHLSPGRSIMTSSTSPLERQ